MEAAIKNATPRIATVCNAYSCGYDSNGEDIAMDLAAKSKSVDKDVFGIGVSCLKALLERTMFLSSAKVWKHPISTGGRRVGHTLDIDEEACSNSQP
jgi:hypothetical protein